MFPGGKVEVVGSTTFLATEQYKGYREVNFPILSLQLNQTSKAEAKLLSRKQKTDEKQRMEKLIDFEKSDQKCRNWQLVQRTYSIKWIFLCNKRRVEPKMPNNPRKKEEEEYRQKITENEELDDNRNH